MIGRLRQKQQKPRRTILLVSIHKAFFLCYYKKANISNIKIFKKLIRDKMPEIMRAQGKELDVRVLDDAEFKEALRRKIIEEISELKDAKDGAEAMDKIAYLHEKKRRRGGGGGVLSVKDKI